MSENVIISCGVGGWYPYGVKRLEHSLQQVGWAGDALLYVNEYPPGCPTHAEVPYAFKVKSFHAAIQKGHRYILWCDSSVWAVKNPEPIFSILQNQGYYIWDSGHWCDTWVNDKTLKAFGVTRQEAHSIRMLSANIMGFDAYSSIAMDFLKKWNWAMDQGLFVGHWTRLPGDTEENPYLGHRHDQSSASIIAHQLKMNLDPIGVNCQYAQEDPARMSPTISLTLRGM